MELYWQKYYMECGLTRQVISRMYHFFHDIEIEKDLDLRYERLYLDLNGISESLSEQITGAGKPFFKNNQEATVYQVVSEYYPRSLSWFQAIENLVEKIELDSKTKRYWLFYVECTLLVKILSHHQKEIEKQTNNTIKERYQSFHYYFDHAIKSLKQEARIVKSKYLSNRDQKNLKIKVDDFTNRLVDEYVEIIHEALFRYGKDVIG